MLVHFKFDETQGDRAVNSAGTVPSAAIPGVAWTAGRAGGALKSNGTDTMVTLDDSKLELGRNNSDFTVAFWIKLTDNDVHDWRNLTHRGATDAERTFAIWLRPDSNHLHFRITTFANANDGGDSAGELKVDQWTHIAYVKRGMKLVLYLDGKKDTEVDLSGAVMFNNAPIYIGKDPWYRGPAALYDDYRIYTRALTEVETRILAK